jgi:HSP20 family molecular chaperone IbpA
MAIDQTKGLQTRETRDPSTTTEATRPGALFTPPVDIFEDPHAITVLADMPGVKPGHLKIDLHEGVLTITGHADIADGPKEVPVLEEYRAGTYQRSFTLSEAIDQGQIQATLKHGVLRLRLPKAEQAKPRQIKIRTD